MLAIFLLSACFAIALSGPVSQNTILLNYRASLLDQLYGDLIDTADSRDHKLSLIKHGKVLAETFEQESKDQHWSEDQFAEILMDDGSFNVHLIDKCVEDYNEKLRINSLSNYLKYQLKVELPDNDDTSDITVQGIFGGILSFAGFKTMSCFSPQTFDKAIDIAIVGAPFDTGTSYRPGARFGPEAIRLAARRLREGVTPVRGNGPNSKLRHVNPYDKKSHNLTIIDCGDVPMTPFDNRFALNQLYRGQRAIHNHSTSGKLHIKKPKIITMGGDHTITLMALRLVYETYGKVAVLHFDSHIDTWDPRVLGGGYSDYMSLNHGTFLHYAAENGYLETGKCFHLGLRAPYILPEYDKKHDKKCGFNTITARDIDTLGVQAMVDSIKNTVGDLPVYVSVDIDVLDPSSAPGTGTMEIGGWTGRELLTVLDALEGLHVVGADVVEVSPPFDTNSEITSLAATAVIDSILGLIIVDTV